MSSIKAFVERFKLEYPKGLKFTCIKCGLCCGDIKTKKRHIMLLKHEAELISSVTSQATDAFAVKACGKMPYVFEMKKTKAGQCFFLKNCECTIYAYRPIVCRFYPFSLEQIGKTGYRFLQTQECPGVGKGKELSGNYFEGLLRVAQMHFARATAGN